MIHVITKKDAGMIADNAKSGNGKCLGLPEMSSDEWDFEKDYQTAQLWARFCLGYVFPDEARHIVLGWRRADGTQNLLRCPEVYTDDGFKDFVGFASRNKFAVVYAVHK